MGSPADERGFAEQDHEVTCGMFCAGCERRVPDSTSFEVDGSRFCNLCALAIVTEVVEGGPFGEMPLPETTFHYIGEDTKRAVMTVPYDPDLHGSAEDYIREHKPHRYASIAEQVDLAMELSARVPSKYCTCDEGYSCPRHARVPAVVARYLRMRARRAG